MQSLQKISVTMLALLAFSSPSSAATFFGEFWNAQERVKTLATANTIIESGGPTATFQSSAIDYPQGRTNSVRGRSITLNEFLGSDAASLIGPSSMNLRRSVFRFTGFLELTEGPQRFSVGSDDGFQLKVNGKVIASNSGARDFQFTNVTTDAGAGRKAFELIYYENNRRAGVEFFIDRTLAVPSPVSLPGGLVLLFSGLTILGFSRRLQSST